MKSAGRHVSDPSENDALDEKAISSLLGEDLKKRLSLEVLGEVDSTNLRLRERAKGGAKEGLVIIASSQSAGRGRMGRSFYSPDGSGLYMSVLLRPKKNAAPATEITTSAAVAVCRAIGSVFGIDAGIKWVNDVFRRGEKGLRHTDRDLASRGYGSA
jgi:BirA family biotin operon repressor/biotin-[acetyl-CoA-carboxylase] ligase